MTKEMIQDTEKYLQAMTPFKVKVDGPLIIDAEGYAPDENGEFIAVNLSVSDTCRACKVVHSFSPADGLKMATAFLMKEIKNKLECYDEFMDEALKKADL